jgi:hypothetical protein
MPAGNAGGAFVVSEDGGQISLGRPLPPNRPPQEFRLTVRAEDGGAPPRHSLVSVTVVVQMSKTASPR